MRSPKPRHSSKVAPANPFAHELAQVSELAEDLGLDLDEETMFKRGLYRFGAEDYLQEIMDVMSYPPTKANKMTSFFSYDLPLLSPPISAVGASTMSNEMKTQLAKKPSFSKVRSDIGRSGSIRREADNLLVRKASVVRNAIGAQQGAGGWI